MQESTRQSDPVTVGFLGKVAGLFLFFVFLALGLVGLVLPIIPGLLFLLLALYVLSRISNRFAFLVRRNSWFRRSLRRLSHVRTLPPSDWLRLGFWMTARGAVNAVSGITRFFSRAVTRSGQTVSRNTQSY